MGSGAWALGSKPWAWPGPELEPELQCRRAWPRLGPAGPAGPEPGPGPWGLGPGDEGLAWVAWALGPGMGDLDAARPGQEENFKRTYIC